MQSPSTCTIGRARGSVLVTIPHMVRVLQGILRLLLIFSHLHDMRNATFHTATVLHIPIDVIPLQISASRKRCNRYMADRITRDCANMRYYEINAVASPQELAQWMGLAIKKNFALVDD